MCKPPIRSGRIVTKPISIGGAWSKPSPRAEARACVKIALSNGGLASMRALIAVNEREMGALFAWAAGDPDLVARVEQAIVFRERVLLEFDRLATPAVPV
jgi:hypothetical protein